MPVKRWNPSGVAPPVAFYSHLAEAQTGSRVVAMAGPLPWPLVHHWRPN